jgi:septum formation inhibitor MinC
MKQDLLKEQQEHFNTLISQEKSALIDVMGGEDAWGNEQRSVDMKLASEYLSGKGFTEADMNKILDHKLWTVIFDAAKSQKFKETETKVKEQIRKAPKSVKPGQKTPPAQRKMKSIKKRIATGNRQEQISALAEFIQKT